MQVAPPVDQICKKYKWRHLVAKIISNTWGATRQPIFLTDASGATWLPSFQVMQVVPPGDQDFQLMQE